MCCRLHFCMNGAASSADLQISSPLSWMYPIVASWKSNSWRAAPWLRPEWSLSERSVFSVRGITAFLGWGTLDSTSALARLGGYFKYLITNQNGENMALPSLWDGQLFAECESWREEAVPPRETSAGNVHVEWLKVFATLCGSGNGPECTINTDFELTDTF